MADNLQNSAQPVRNEAQEKRAEAEARQQVTGILDDMGTDVKQDVKYGGVWWSPY